jgi:hypothetical protein
MSDTPRTPDSRTPAPVPPALAELPAKDAAVPPEAEQGITGGRLPLNPQPLPPRY